MKSVICLLFFSLLFSTVGVAQERKTEEPVQEEKEANPFQENPASGKQPRLDPRNFKKAQERERANEEDRRTSERNQQKEKKKKGKRKREATGKSLTVTKETNKKKSFQFSEGDRVVIIDNEDESYRGKLSSITPKEVMVGDSTVAVKEITKIRRGFLPVLKKKSAGTGLFIGGAAVTAGGIALGLLSTTVFSSGGPFIIVTAAGITAMLGIDIVGVSISVEGTKLLIEKTRFSIGEKWILGVK